MEGMQNQGSNDPGGGYQPIEPGYSAPPQKKGGFNWLACCGISCGVILVITIIFAVIGINMGRKFMDSLQPMITAAEDIENTPIDEIRAAASPASGEEVGSNPDDFEGDWLALEGEIMNPADFAKNYYGEANDVSRDINSSMREEGTAYFLKGGIMMIDTSNQASKATEGDMVRGYGKLMILDFATMPLIGPMMKAEMGDNTEFKFFIAKEVEAIDGDDEGTQEAPPAEDAGDGSGAAE